MLTKLLRILVHCFFFSFKSSVTCLVREGDDTGDIVSTYEENVRDILSSYV